ncbi:MAG: hypothetical protein ACU0FH_00450 [Heliomarina sp.]|uniref:hypothetical protein n=1 Tax=Heliomarina sp. TaxID=2917556 RepID=UPI0040581097
MTLETLFVIFGIAGSVGALYVAWRAHKNAFKPTGPDEELVERFVETAPLHLLHGLTAASKPLPDQPVVDSH